MSLSDYTSITNFNQIECKSFNTVPIIVYCYDITSVCSEDILQICSIVIYNIGFSLYLNATKLRIQGERLSRLSGSSEVLEYSSSICQILNKSDIQIAMNRELLKLSVSWLSNNLLRATSDDHQELDAVIEMKKSRKELENIMNEMKLEESRIYGNLLQQKAAPSA